MSSHDKFLCSSSQNMGSARATGPLFLVWRQMLAGSDLTSFIDIIDRFMIPIFCRCYRFLSRPPATKEFGHRVRFCGDNPNIFRSQEAISTPAGTVKGLFRL
jgi:hypothetical protein